MTAMRGSDALKAGKGQTRISLAASLSKYKSAIRVISWTMGLRETRYTRIENTATVRAIVSGSE